MSRALIRSLLFFAIIFGFARLAFAQAPSAERIASVDREHGFITIRLPLLRHRPFQFPDKVDGLVLEFGGVLDGKPVGVYALIVMDWEEQKEEGVPFSFWWSAARLERAGNQTDQFVQLLASLYGQKTVPPQAKDAVPIKVVSIAKKPTVSSPEIKLKAFIEGPTEEDYAEFYLNIDFKAEMVSLFEKDTEYRTAIIRALAKTP